MNAETLRTRRCRGVAGILCVLSGLALSACGPVRARDVNVELARDTLVDVLDHWKNGGDIEELRDQSPEIVAQEPMWSNGMQLLDYSLNGEGRAENCNWYCEVDLTLKAKDGGEPVHKTVTYVVGTDPVLTVFHALL